jgi:hypothetical protein
MTSRQGETIGSLNHTEQLSSGRQHPVSFAAFLAFFLAAFFVAFVSTQEPDYPEYKPGSGGRLVSHDATPVSEYAFLHYGLMIYT